MHFPDEHTLVIWQQALWRPEPSVPGGGVALLVRPAMDITRTVNFLRH
jgi:hypothetical protein